VPAEDELSAAAATAAQQAERSHAGEEVEEDLGGPMLALSSAMMTSLDGANKPPPVYHLDEEIVVSVGTP
jgi:hypothetical protein